MSTVLGRGGRINFDRVNQAALRILPLLLRRWLPGGKAVGHEFLALNPRRTDRHVGSFKINLGTGRWCDFATGDRGGDIVSLAAFLGAISQTEAAEQLAKMLG